MSRLILRPVEANVTRITLPTKAALVDDEHTCYAPNYGGDDCPPSPRLQLHLDSMNPELHPGPEEAALTALPAGTQLRVWWNSADEYYTCRVVEWRFVHGIGSGGYTMIHRCDYDGGVLEHDLTKESFEIVGELPTELSDVAPASPSSPLKGVVQRGTTRVWECEARVVQQPMAEEDDFMLSPEKAQVLVQ